MATTETIRTEFAPLADDSTRKLAAFVVGARFEDLPADVVRQAIRCTLDCLGVSIGASDREPQRILIKVGDVLGGESQATVWTTNRRMNVAHAALVNACMANTDSFEDTFVSEVTTVHGSSSIVPPALALGEWRESSGADYLLAFVLGYEIMARVALSAGQALHHQRWHMNSTVGPFGAAAAAGKLLGLNETEMTYALGIAGTQAGGFLEVLGSMTKAFHAGRSAMNGVVAALLAQEGFTSAEDILTGKFGFHTIFPSDRDFEALVGDLGSRWALRQTGFKPYACGINLHSGITAVIALRDKHYLQAADVDAIRLRVDPHVLVPTGKKDPKTGADGRYSVYHTMAVALIDGAVGLAQFTTARVTDPEVIALRKRVLVTPDDSLQRAEAHVAIQLRDGRVFEDHLLHPPGTPENPMSDEQLIRKFRSLVEPEFGLPRTNKLLESVQGLETLPNVAELARQMAN